MVNLNSDQAAVQAYKQRTRLDILMRIVEAGDLVRVEDRQKAIYLLFKEIGL